MGRRKRKRKKHNHTSSPSPSSAPSPPSTTPTNPPEPPLILGSLHSGLVPLLSAQTLTPRAVIARRQCSDDGNDGKEGGRVLAQISIEYAKWLIPTPAPTTTTTATTATATMAPRVYPRVVPTLPHGYAFSPLEVEELGLVVRRTAIPKRVRTLGGLAGVGVRRRGKGGRRVVDGDGDGGDGGDGGLVAWGFIGVDGSLSTLHVEAEERGVGLGKAVAGWLVGMVGVGEGEDGSGGGWVSGDVAVGNEASEGVMRAVGGKRGWMVRWVAVDLGKVVSI